MHSFPFDLKPFCRLKLVVIFSAFFFLSSSLKAQNDGYLEFTGKTVKKSVPFEGAKITVLKGTTKVAELTTTKNGKFSFDLELGSDYKVTFSATGCADMYMMIYGAKCPANKVIFPIYDIEVTFFEYGKISVDFAHLSKHPFTKVVFDGNKAFKDDEQYVTSFLKDIYVTPEELQKREDDRIAKEKAEKDKLAGIEKAEKDKLAHEKAEREKAEKERLAKENAEKDLLAKQKMEEEERIRLEQIALAEKKAKAEAEALARLMKEKNKLEKKNEVQNVVAKKQNDTNQSLVKEEVKLTLEKEQKKVKEKQNKAIKANFESDLLKMVAQNERVSKESDFKKQKDKAEINEVIETLSQEAIVKAKSDETKQLLKLKNKQSVLNSRIINQELTSLIKVVAYNDLSVKSITHKTFPEAKKFKPRTMVGITTDTQSQAFKTTYIINVSEAGTTTIYKKEKYSWGLTYYYKNDKEISEKEYQQEVSRYNTPL